MSIVNGQTITAADILALGQPQFIPTIMLNNSITHCNSDIVANINASGTTFFIESALAQLQSRQTTTDWATAAAICSIINLGAFCYVLLRDAGNNYRLYRYSNTALSSGGTLCTFSGQTLSTTGGATVRITTDGTNFYLNYKGGNSANSYVVSKYTISGTTLTYGTDITCGSTASSLDGLQADVSGNLYGYLSGVIRKFNSGGTLQYSSATYSSVYAADSFCRILQAMYLGYANGAGTAGLCKVYLP